ncbi:MAG TPA: bifunctional glutamine-synthetase adenylyltransferase/deadenyltransferase, partial [Actinomycetales bacterium]|nr:bifunctional glutamine-synthetase adenylyltransferase/deadenyltransferase [Actinomycetales bacterium]
MTDGRRRTSASGRLARFGFADPRRAERLLADPALAGLVDPLEDVFDDGLLQAIRQTADPDQALLGLARFMEQVNEPSFPATDRAGLVGDLLAGGRLRDRLLAVLGASPALTDHVVRHPEHWAALEEDAPAGADIVRDRLLSSVGADPAARVPVAAGSTEDAYDRLRVAYHRQLLGVAGRDLAASDPAADVDDVSRQIADLASAALEAALAIARCELPDHGRDCRLAVIGMGKCGGRELNYVSDVDVIYVAEPCEGADETAALAVGARLAA